MRSDAAPLAPAPAAPGGEVRALRYRLHDADDVTMLKVLSLLDQAADPAANETLLAPVRARLAAIRPLRPLRFERLLFMPLDPVIVPARDWRAGEPTLPRTAIAPLSGLVRAGLGEEAALFDRLLQGRDTGEYDLITRVGASLWPAAAGLLDRASTPGPDWEGSGLRPDLFIRLARAVAAVLRRAVLGRNLVRSLQDGLVQADAATFAPLLAGLEAESDAGCAMAASVILVRLPAAAPFLARTLPDRAASARARLHGALSQAVDQVLSTLEGPDGSIAELGRAPLTRSADEVRQLVALLDGLESGAGAALHRTRTRPIRERLDRACRARFADGLETDVLRPLAQVRAPLDGAGQRRLEGGARDLRRLEQAARTLGGAATYDRMLAKAAEQVSTIPLPLAQRARLIEILAGPDAAEALYHG